MNEVTIFNDITTEQALLAIEADSKKYNADIVADMHNDDDLAEKARLAANQEHVATVHRNMKAV